MSYIPENEKIPHSSLWAIQKDSRNVSKEGRYIQAIPLYKLLLWNYRINISTKGHLFPVTRRTSKRHY